MSGHVVLLTGATGFVGKVVLEELMRRRSELGVREVILLVRPGKTRAGDRIEPRARFERGIADVALFAGLAPGWTEAVSVVACDLEQPRAGMSEADFAAVTARVTHVIHCAASIEFDLPIQQAAMSNINTALEVLEVARACKKLVGMVDVSTAYVTPWRKAPIREELVHLPRPAEETWRDIRDGRRSEAEMLAETGHPNTYTFTKCLSEHLVSQRRGNVPVIVVRPSIVSASYQHPFPGWLDSPAALAGCLLYTGLGVVRAFKADPATRLDVVPVDVVSSTIIKAAFFSRFPKPGEPEPIRYAAMGVEHAMRIDLAGHGSVDFFKVRPGVVSVPNVYIGKDAHDFARVDLLRRELPTQMTRALLMATFRTRDVKRLDRADEKVRYLNAAFEYFTHHTFDFRAEDPVVPEGFNPAAYVQTVYRGMYKHLLKYDERELTFAGAAHDDGRDDVTWVREHNNANAATRALGLGLRKAMRRCSESITFDRVSFERAIADASPDTRLILAPTHRSYLDFLLMSYLAFQHPELRIPMPHIAAAEEFGNIPVVGKILQEAGAFYIKRGLGKEAPDLNHQLKRIAHSPASLMFFVEGQRSRSRHTLSPKRGLLRGLQASEQRFTVLPIAMAYDRLPEEFAFERELRGGTRSRMSLGAILKWLGQLARDEVQLGRMHVACGEPIELSPHTDVPALAMKVVSEQQTHMAVSSFHLRTFLAEPVNAELVRMGVDEAYLTAALRARGARVIASNLPVPANITPWLGQSLRNQWAPWFMGDALALHPNDPVVAEYIERNVWMPLPEARDLEDARNRGIVDSLLLPVIRDYRTVVSQLRGPDDKLVRPTPLSLVRAMPTLHLPHLEDAYAALAARGVLSRTEDGYTWGPGAHDGDGLAAPGDLFARPRIEPPTDHDAPRSKPR